MSNSLTAVLRFNEVVLLSVINIVKLATRFYPWDFGKPKRCSLTLLYRIEFARTPADREGQAWQCIENNPHIRRIPGLYEYAPITSFSDHYAGRFGIESKPPLQVGSEKGFSRAEDAEVVRRVLDPGFENRFPILIHNRSTDMYRFRKEETLGCLRFSRHRYHEK